ncbi:MAG: DNA mismatch repair protein MutS [Eubacteriales bacterium]|nr:DNA mismatch repair protein MutS [Eubacteriales bacterium]
MKNEAKSKLSPMMLQYLEIKKEHQDAILFFRLGDFYEMFFDDAKTASRELELTLTGKQCGLEERAPMCGVPFHSAETYISILIEKGYKVAICEQTEDPASAKGIVKREVVQIVTPGTAMGSTMLKENENNYIASVFAGENALGLAYCDISTGEISLTSIDGTGRRDSLINELVKINAREVIMDANTADALGSEELRIVCPACFNIAEEGFYRPDAVKDSILSQFNVSALFGIGIEEDAPPEFALGALLLYMHDNQKNDLSHIRNLNIYSMGQRMSLDKSTIKNLELTETLFEKKLQGSLLGILDKTHTAMGSRKMKQWIKEPLNDVVLINERLDSVEYLINNPLTRNNLKEHLKQIYDFERLAGRIATGKANARDLIALKNSCFVLPDIKSELYTCNVPMLNKINGEISTLEDAYEIIDSGIIDEPPFTVKEGGIIKAGYSEELDKLKASISDARNWIGSLEASERERTGIKKLKVGFNKVFGYYIEVTRSYYDLIPDDYIRKQTLVNCERFITPKLKETERLVLNAESEINRIEYRLFSEIREKLMDYISLLQTTSKAISSIDVLVAFAQVSENNNYSKPEVDDSEEITIEAGRHPVIEKTIQDGIFVSNDTYMNRYDSNLLIITGPNMSGKSTYMRQTALIVLMAQAGCYVPAAKANIGVCDRIFTRIGASDNLALGQSTFFVEMSELSYILNTATSKSLVILDEIGRGTSTYDGLSIAWAAAEYICKPERRIRTLFATHYHEMTVLENTLEGVNNLNVDVSEESGNIIFLHKIVPGSASRSYGIHVAKLAGAPYELLENAQIHLDALNRDNEKNLNTVSRSSYVDISPDEVQQEMQLSLFDGVPNAILQRLRDTDLMNTTPSEALKLLEELKSII